MTHADSDLVDLVRVRLARDGSELDATRVAAALRQEGRLVGDRAVLSIVDELHREVAGAGPLTPLLAGPGVTDVLVNGPDQVYVDDGAGLRATTLRFDDDASVRRLAQRLAATAGRRLDDAEPYVDVRLRDGTRFHAVLSPPAFPGTCLSLRVPPRRVLTLDELHARGSSPRPGRDWWRRSSPAGSPSSSAEAPAAARPRCWPACCPSSSRASGSSLSRTPPSSGRDTHTSSVSRLVRPNVEGRGEITLRTLVRQALRMRPDRLVVGEVRGGEVVDLLAALNTGHQGGCGTVHANAAADVPARFEALGLAAGLDRSALHAQLAAAVSVVLHLARGRDGVRRLAEVGVSQRVGDTVVVTSALLFDADGGESEGPGSVRLAELLSESGGDR